LNYDKIKVDIIFIEDLETRHTNKYYTLVDFWLNINLANSSYVHTHK
jgi:hypothetical protein